MSKEASEYPYFMSHPFWNILRIGGGNNISQILLKLNADQRKSFITEAIKGFYPVSYASLLSFKRFGDLAEDPESKEIAYMIYEVEKGDNPLIKGSEMTGILHCDQLKMMFESLIGEDIHINSPETFDVLQNAKIEDASIVKSMAICDTIKILHLMSSIFIRTF